MSNLEFYEKSIVKYEIEIEKNNFYLNKTITFFLVLVKNIDDKNTNNLFYYNQFIFFLGIRYNLFIRKVSV